MNGSRSLVLLAVSAIAALPASAQTCDRACLEGFVDQYLDALVANDMSRLPTTADLKMTEDGVRLLPGDGFLRSANGKGSYRLVVADPETSQVAFLTTMMEDPANPVILASRLKVAGNQVSQIESIIVRNSSGASALDRLRAPHASFTSAVSAPADRNELARIANLYFSGIENNDGNGEYPIAETCDRVENGYRTTNNPGFNPDSLSLNNPPPAGGGEGRGKGKAAPKGKAPAAKGKGPVQAKAAPAPPPPIDIFALGCRQQLETGFFGYITRVRDRRFTAVDTERGLLFTFVFFDEPSGPARNVTLKDGRQFQAGAARPVTWEIAEVFKIDGGSIQRVESVLQQVPYGMGSGWSSRADAMSSEPQMVQ